MWKVFVLGLMLVGCGGVRPASVEKQNVDVGDVLRFAPDAFEGGHLRLPKITLFLWKEKITGEDVFAVNKISEKTSDLDKAGVDLGKKYAWIDEKSDERRSANSQMKKLEKDIKNQEKVVANSKKAVDQANQDVKKNQEALETAQKARDEEAGKAAPDAEKLKALEQALQIAKETLATSEKDLETKSRQAEIEDEKLTQIRASIEPRIQELGLKIATLDEEIAKGNAEKKQEEDRIIQETTDQVNKLKTLVDYFEGAPKLIEVDLKDPSNPVVVVQLWDAMDGLGRRTYVSCAQSEGCYSPGQEEAVVWADEAGQGVQGVQYKEQGGRVQFSIRTGDDFRYDFNFARVDYADTSKINMSGDVTRTYVGSDPLRVEPVRYGVIKASDMKN